MNTPRPIFGLMAVVALVVVAGCTEQTPPPDQATVTVTTPADEPEASPTPDESPLPDVGPDDDAPFYANTLPDTESPSAGALLSPTDLRYGVHDGFDRIVLDLSGNGTPGWRVEYVDQASGQASGEPVMLAGDADLVILVQGIIYPTEDGAEPYEGPSLIVPGSGGVVREIRYGSIFEGQLEIFVGLSSQEPFRAFALQSPTRLVIDVQQP